MNEYLWFNVTVPQDYQTTHWLLGQCACYPPSALYRETVTVRGKDCSSKIIWQCLDSAGNTCLPINGRTIWWKEGGNGVSQQKWDPPARAWARRHTLRLISPSTLNENDTEIQTSVLVAEAWNCLFPPAVDCVSHSVKQESGPRHNFSLYLVLLIRAALTPAWKRFYIQAVRLFLWMEGAHCSTRERSG